MLILSLRNLLLYFFSSHWIHCRLRIRLRIYDHGAMYSKYMAPRTITLLQFVCVLAETVKLNKENGGIRRIQYCLLLTASTNLDNSSLKRETNPKTTQHRLSFALSCIMHGCHDGAAPLRVLRATPTSRQHQRQHHLPLPDQQHYELQRRRGTLHRTFNNTSPICISLETGR